MFREPGEFIKYLQGLIARHNSDLAIILNSLDIEGPPTPERLIYAHEKAPVRFTQLLAELGEPFMNFGPLETEAQTPEAKQTFFEKVFSTGKQIISAVKQTRSAAPAAPGAGVPDEPAPSNINTKKILLIGGLIVVVLVVVFIVIKSLKNK